MILVHVARAKSIKNVAAKKTNKNMRYLAKLLLFMVFYAVQIITKTIPFLTWRDRYNQAIATLMCRHQVTVH